MYVNTRPVLLGQTPPQPRSWPRDVLVTTVAIVVGTVVVEQLRRRGVL